MVSLENSKLPNPALSTGRNLTQATNVCNFRCRFCPQSDLAHHDYVPRTYLELKSAEIIFMALRRGGVMTETLHWTLDGEPFMNKNFALLCRSAIKFGFRNMYFATNGMLLSQNIIEALPSGGNYTLTIDYTSDALFFERIRGTTTSWERIRSNIQRILDDPSLQHIKIEIQDILTYENLRKETLEQKHRELKALFRDQNRRLTIHRKTFHNAAGTVEKLVETSSKRRYHLCPYPWTSFSIASNGDVVACCRDLRHQTVLGNILTQPLNDIWRGSAFAELRRNLSERRPNRSTACSACDLPYDDAKFRFANMFRAARGRFQIFDG